MPKSPYFPDLLEQWCQSGISTDTRTLKEGETFFALPGMQTHGIEHITQAFALGARVVMDARYHQVAEKYPAHKVMVVPDIHRALFCALECQYPFKFSHISAVTGTNGKTSVTHFAQQLWALCGIPSASVGTLGVCCQGSTSYPTYEGTVPDVVSLYKILSQIYADGVTHVALEATSHALDQGRLGHLSFDSAVWTSFSAEHLDYHQTMEQYQQAKVLLFSQYLDVQGTAIVSKGLDFCSWVLEQSRTKKSITYGKDGDFQWNVCRKESGDSRVRATYCGQSWEFSVALDTELQIENLMAAAIIVRESGVDFGRVFSKMSRVVGVPGRWERVARNHWGSPIIIDFAHTPDALEAILKPHFAKAGERRKIWLVAGAGGNRHLECPKSCQSHTERRFLMGQVASAYSHEFCLTDDNFRREDPAHIRKEVALGCVGNYHEFSGRFEAIRYACDHAQSDDLVVIAGRGSEQGRENVSEHHGYQSLSDRAMVEKALDGDGKN